MADILSPAARIYGLPEEALAPQEPMLDPEQEAQMADEIQRELEDKLKNLGNYVRSLFEEFDGSSVRRDMLKTIQESRRAYYQETEATNFPWPNASNMIAPLTTMGVDEVEPRMVAAVIGKEPYIKAKKLKGVSTDEEAWQITEFDNFILEHKIKVQSLVPELIHEKLIDGTIFPVLSWKTETKKVNRMVPDPQNPQGLSKQIQEVTTESPTVELVPVEYVWMPDDVNDEDWESAPVIRYIGNITIGELKERSQREVGWVAPENLERYIAMDLLKTTQQETEGVQDYFRSYSMNQKPIEFLEAYIKFDFFGEDQIDENLIVLVERQTFKVFRVREQIEVIDENKKPIRRMRFLKRRGISWGYPLYTLIAGIQLGVDAMWNRCVNSADITMTPWGFIKRGMSGLRKNKVEVYPGNLIELDNPEAINFPNLSMFQPTQFIPLIMQFISFFERTLNVTDFMQGRESQVVGKKGSTATGTMAILQEGKIKFEYRGGLTHLEFLDFFKDIHDLCVSNMSIPDQIKIAGAPILKYSSTDEYLFTLVGSDLTSNRFVDRQETESLVTTMQPFIEMMNPMFLITELLHSYDKEVEDAINPELAQLVQQWMMQQREIKAMVAMGIPEEIAKQAVAKGFTAENAKTFISQMGAGAGQAQTDQMAQAAEAMEGQSGTESGTS